MARSCPTDRQLTAPSKAYLLLAALLLGSVGILPGCNWLQNEVAGKGFQPWSKDMGDKVRDDGEGDAPPEHSGYFFDRKAQQIEENLGGGF